MIVSGEIKNLKISNNELLNIRQEETVRIPDEIGEEYYLLKNLSNSDNFTNPLSLLILEDGNWGYYDYTLKKNNKITEKEVKYFYKNNISKKNKYSSVDKTFG